jgi:23S rRNA (adenine2503-C2)-methyltransferase
MTDVVMPVNLLGLDEVGHRRLLRNASASAAFMATQTSSSGCIKQGVVDLDAMTDLGKSLREMPEGAETEIRSPRHRDWHSSARDGTRQVGGRTGRYGKHVETVFIPEGERGTLCVSSQVGCPLDCSLLLHRPARGSTVISSVAEIIGQVWVAARELGRRRRGSPTNVVMMGMGEPLLNFDNVVRGDAPDDG